MFQMQSWSASAACTCDIGTDVHKPKCPYPSATWSWVPMEDGAAKAHWKPKKVAQDAAYQCMRWTGLLSIPPMQVVNMETGEVVWRAVDHSANDPDDRGAGDPITPDWAVTLAAQVKREQQAQAAKEREAAEPKPRAGNRTNPQGALW